MDLKRTWRVIHQIFHFRNIINKYGDVLHTGKFYLYPTKRAIVYNNPETISCADKYFAKGTDSSKATKLISLINKTPFYYNFGNKNSADKFDAIYSANNYDKIREIKFFSFDKKQILIICSDEESYKKQFDKFNKLSNYFGMPELTICPKYNNSYFVSMVDLLPLKGDQFALEDIIACTTAYHSAHLEGTKKLGTEKITDFSEYTEDYKSLLKKLSDSLSTDVKSQLFPTCMQHGDLSRDNIIYGTCNDVTGFWWIDWEHSGDRIFFYDYFFYILNTAIYSSDTSALEAYLHGAFDDQLTQWFANFGLNFMPNHRQDYFIVFAIDFLKGRVCDKQNLIALKDYIYFIEKNIFNKE